MNKFRFKLGETVKDKITSFQGVVIARTEYLTGCNRYSIQTKDLHEGKPVEWQQFDEDQLEKVKEKITKIKTDKTKGGVKPKILRNYK